MSIFQSHFREYIIMALSMNNDYLRCISIDSCVYSYKNILFIKAKLLDAQ